VTPQQPSDAGSRDLEPPESESLRAPAHSAELHSAELHSAELHSAELHSAELHSAELLDTVVLVSGRGSNLRAIFEAIDAGRCRARVAAVISDRARAPALELAAARGVPTAVVRPADHGGRAGWDPALAEAIATHAPSLVVLAGFMRIVGPAVLERFAGRVINVHPALLPAFPGLDAAAQAVRAGVRISGCTVHVVDAGVDTGPILAQAAVPVLSGDTPEALHARIQRCEHALLPAVIDAVARGELALDPPRFASQPRETPEALFSPTL
jgi:phosphoribosylglycinamide formyltransferase-1